MKLNLSKEWYENRIQPDEEFEVGAGCPPASSTGDETTGAAQEPVTDEGLAENVAFGTLIQLLRRDRRLTVEDLASSAGVDVAEIVKIELDPKYVPHPRSVHQLARFFDLPQRA